METKTKLIATLTMVAVVSASLITAGIITYVNSPSLTLTGSLYFNDSGEHHGGFEAAMQWNVTLSVKAGYGLLIVTPEPGYMNNERLQKWSYSISGFQITEECIVMAIDGHQVVLEFVENDTIWNTYDNHYISATPAISPTIFPGFISHFYVELRLSGN